MKMGRQAAKPCGFCCGAGEGRRILENIKALTVNAVMPSFPDDRADKTRTHRDTEHTHRQKENTPTICICLFFLHTFGGWCSVLLRHIIIIRTYVVVPGGCCCFPFVVCPPKPQEQQQQQYNNWRLLKKSIFVTSSSLSCCRVPLVPTW